MVPARPPTEVDVLVVGAGLSGIGAAYHLQTLCPDRSYLILESREAIGGTWDLFRYPGVRSDSDMYTLGYRFEPWTGNKALADGQSILRYIREVAAKHGIDERIRFSHRVLAADWSSEDACWTVMAERTDTGEQLRFRSQWLHMAAGYYDYAGGHLPDFPGRERFRGPVIHPQFWPEDLDCAGKRVVVIGSGATAVTLVPALAERAAHVTMLQRSPTYIMSLPARDRIADALRRLIGDRRAYALVRWKNVLLQMLMFNAARRWPGAIKRNIVKAVRKELGADYDVATHFTPSYNPWDQRLCLVPDGDLFAAMRGGRAEVATGHIETFTEAGIRLTDGTEIPADIIVAATGLRIQLLGGAAVTLDGQPRDLSKALLYKGMMFSDVPNLSISFGYTNASWTLKADLIAAYLCRILNRMARKGCTTAVARRGPGVGEVPFVDFTSSYVERARAILPKQGSRAPWRLHQNYALDTATLRFGRIEDGVLHLEGCENAGERSSATKS
jgi:cation diffusion facilitator CzcD-associated flavoprotein CzcO